MNEYKIPGIWKWSVLLLVFCNIGLILTIWLKPNLGGNPRPETPRDYVIRNLTFTDDQVKKYDALIQVHRQAMDQLRKEGKEYRQLFFSNLGNESKGINTDSVAQLIANNQKQIEMATYMHFRQVRALCNDAQKTEFDKIITDVMKKMNGGMRGGPPPRPGDGQRPPPDRGEEDHQPGDGQGPPPPGPAQNP